MQQDELVTISGKPVTVPASFRLPLPSYPQIITYCKQRGVTLSSATWQLWQRALELEKKEESSRDLRR